MSRVRILNLPNDCTEESLKDFFLKSAPRTAPPLQITDVSIKRAVPVAPSRRGPAAPVLGKIRMAFVGFQNSAAGNFVAQHYNNSYFRSAKIRVELAKGLNEVGTTLNMRKRQERLEEWQRIQEATHPPKRPRADASDRKEGAPAVPPTQKGPHETATDHVTEEERKGTGENPTESYRAHRKQLFIDERAQATEGPSWAAAVLLPSGAAAPDASSGKTAPDDPTAKKARPSSSSVVAGAKASAPTAAEVGSEEIERVALARQQALGEVSDMAFLQTLGGGTGAVEEGTDEPPDDGPSDYEHETVPPRAAVREDDGEVTGDEVNAARERNAADDPTIAKDSADKATPEDIAWESRRVRLGNIPYTATEDHVKQFASNLVGPVEAVHIPLTRDTKQSKGAAFVRFTAAEDAVRALTLCRGSILMGRLLRVSAAEEDPHALRAARREAQQATTSTGDTAGSSNFKLRKALDKRQLSNAAPGSSHIAWNSMYMNSHAAVQTISQRLGVKTDDVVNVEARGAAVRAAIAEAYLTSEIQQVLSDEGVNLEAIESGQGNLLKARSSTTILAKNLQLKGPDEAAELSKMFVKFGALETSVFPSAGAFALFRYAHPQDARIAFTRLAYKLFKNAPLFLEWAPVGAIVEDADELPANPEALSPQPRRHLADNEEDSDDEGDKAGSTTNAEEAKVADAQRPSAPAMVYTLFITNLPFNETDDDFYAFLLDACPRLAKAPDVSIQRLVHQKEQGRAFLTLCDAPTFAYCLAKLNGKSFGGRVLSCVASKQTAQQHQQKTVDPRKQQAEDDEDASLMKSTVIARSGQQHSSATSRVPPGCDPHKLIVKNLPFEATEKDVRELFAAFSEVRSVRVPRKTNNFTTHRENNHRGFAFVEFLSEAEAARAFDVLTATHLYGRHLVLQYAKME